MKKNLIVTTALILFLGTSIKAQTEFKEPPQEIMALADVEAQPLTQISSKNSYMALLARSMYKNLEELAEDELRLAGLRINPENFNQSRSRYYTGLEIQKLPSAETITITGLPTTLQIQQFSFSPDEKSCAFVQVGQQGLSLWIIDLNSGQAKELANNQLNASMGSSYLWGNKQNILILSKGNKQKASSKKELAKGPSTQDATGTMAPARTYQDLLRNQQDETVFDHYAQATLVEIDIQTGLKKEILPEGIYKRLSISPDGQYILTEEVQKPYSYTLPYRSFPSRFNIYTSQGLLVRTFYDRPLQDKVPISFDAVESGKRFIFWRNDAPHTLMWCQAPDQGNPATPSDYRDELFESDYPFTQEKSLCKIKNRLSNIEFGKDGMLVISDYWNKNRNTKTYCYEPQKGGEPKIIFDRSSEDLYSEPGYFVSTYNQYDQPVLQYSKDGKKLYLQGEGYSPKGNRPFIDEYEMASGKTKRLWQADGISTYERIVRIINTDKKLIITSIEAPTIFPNLYIRQYGSKKQPKQITFRENPYKALANVTKKKIHYSRADGVALSANLYLPAGYDKARDGRLPMLMEAYPSEYKDDKAASQIKDSPHLFVSTYWASPIYWVTRGFAVLEDAQFPIIGKGNEEPNDTYIEQLVADAAAAIHAVDSMGIVDPKRCAVMGHSYGAFMTANLLAHSDLFAAGLARSGAYNRTLTPFGFQAEERTYWQAKEVYDRMSPFTYADKIKTPILFIHGDADNNPGTFTLQSERLFQAIKGNGGISRLVLLPYESHSYAARENILHILWEMDNWLIKYVKEKK